MNEQSLAAVGSVTWRDLTVPNAEAVRDFYSQVVGWTFEPLDMGGYADYCMNPKNGGPTVAGICHARGTNANLPPQWLIYITVENVAESADKCAKLGGAIVDGPRSMGGKQFCVIRDPAGAVAALIES